MAIPFPRTAALAAPLALGALLTACATSPLAPVAAGQPMTLGRGVAVELPRGCAWQGFGAQAGGALNQFVCRFEPTHTMGALVLTEPVRPGAEAGYDAEMAGLPDAERLRRAIADLRADAARDRGTLLDFRDAAPPPGAAPVAGGLACRDYAYAIRDTQVPRHLGEPFRMETRGRACLHPATRRPVVVQLSERVREASRPGPRPEFEAEAAAFRDSLRIAP